MARSGASAPNPLGGARCWPAFALLGCGTTYGPSTTAQGGADVDDCDDYGDCDSEAPVCDEACQYLLDSPRTQMRMRGLIVESESAWRGESAPTSTHWEAAIAKLDEGLRVYHAYTARWGGRYHPTVAVSRRYQGLLGLRAMLRVRAGKSAGFVVDSRQVLLLAEQRLAEWEERRNPKHRYHLTSGTPDYEQFRTHLSPMITMASEVVAVLVDH